MVMAKFKAIKNEKDYQDALEEMDDLWDAEEGSPQEARLNQLAELVEAWETSHGGLDWVVDD